MLIVGAQVTALYGQDIYASRHGSGFPTLERIPQVLEELGITEATPGYKEKVRPPSRPASVCTRELASLVASLGQG
eukprot:5888897-Pyramimonas_sp.AAC.1